MNRKNKTLREGADPSGSHKPGSADSTPAPAPKNKTPKRHGGGMPRKKDGEKFTLIAFTAHPRDLARIRKAARAAGLTISAYIRQRTIEKTA